MHGILRQLVKASVKDERPDEVNLGFMISMVKSIKPRDSIEAMLSQRLLRCLVERSIDRLKFVILIFAHARGRFPGIGKL
jgi:hypothetical protein